MGQSTSRAPHEPPPACPKKCYSSSSSSSSLCPVKKCSSSPSPYNVYSQPINSLNNIPQTTAANSLPNPNQTILLDTNRVQSTIPKGNTSTTWIYPSPQMFWNSLNRKGKIGDTKEAEMSVVVAIHNNMNESTWRKVREWERVVSLEAFSEDTHTPIDDVDPSSGPKLLKFLGRPTDLSPKAYLKSLLGHPLPFDRHDWTIQRPDSTTIRYVIDYYVDETKANEAEGSGMVKKNDYGAIKSIMVDVRPALVDSSASAIFTGGERAKRTKRALRKTRMFLELSWCGRFDLSLIGHWRVRDPYLDPDLDRPSTTPLHRKMRLSESATVSNF